STPTPATLTVFGNGVDADGNVASLDTTLSSTANELTLAGTLSGTGATFSLTLDLSDISYSSYESTADAERPSNIGFTSIEDQSVARHAVETVRNKIDD